MHARICSRSELSYTKWRPVRCRFVGEVLELIFEAILDRPPVPALRLNPEVPPS